MDRAETKVIFEALLPIQAKLKRAYVVLIDPCGSVIRVEDPTTGKSGPAIFIHDARDFFEKELRSTSTQ